MVVVLGLALLSEVAVGLDAVLEAVELEAESVYRALAVSYPQPLLLLYSRMQRKQSVSSGATHLPARVCDLATGLAD